MGNTVDPRALEDLWERAYEHMIECSQKGFLRSKMSASIAHAILFTLRRHYERQYLRLYPHGGNDLLEAMYSNQELSLKALQSYRVSQGANLSCQTREEPVSVSENASTTIAGENPDDESSGHGTPILSGDEPVFSAASICEESDEFGFSAASVCEESSNGIA